MIDAKALAPYAGNVLIDATIAELPSHYRGKVRDNYDLPDGRRIIIATDRPMGFVEASRQPRSADYEFLLIEIRLGPDGKGEGKLAAAAKIEYSKEDKTVEVENYGTEPVRLTEVSVVGPKKK